MAELVQAGLGHPVSDQVLVGLVAMQERLQSLQQELAASLSATEISRAEYIRQFDILLQEAARAGERSLGFDDFHKIFGEFHVQNLIDVDAFISGPENGVP